MLARLEIHQGSMVYFHSFGDLSQSISLGKKTKKVKQCVRNV